MGILLLVLTFFIYTPSIFNYNIRKSAKENIICNNNIYVFCVYICNKRFNVWYS